MANAREVRTKIKSITSTKKITKAMQMVAASKMRKAQDRMVKSRPYADRIEEVIRHVSQGNLEYAHPYTIKRKIKRVGIIVISSDRGLCGGLNINLFKSVLQRLTEYNQQNVECDLAVVGTKGFGFFNRINANIVGKISHLGDEPQIKDLIGIIKIMVEAFESAQIDELWICYNNFVNTMTQTPTFKQLLPVAPQAAITGKRWDYIYEPDPISLLTSLLNRYIESLVYQAAVENAASEQAARMVAMQNATDNAGDLIKEFKLIYNKVRQASITQELSEIVAGAAAV